MAGEGGKGPLVSVCVPAYQAEAHLAQTMRSVLAQDYSQLEIVVLDNASTDRTEGILADIADSRVRLLRNPSVLPIADNWNRLVGQARGDLVKVVCADDLIHPELVSRQAAVMRSHPEVALTSCRRHMITEGGAPVARNRGLRGLTGSHEGRETVRRVLRQGGNPIGEPACTMFRRADFEAIGGFDASLLFPMDIDLWVRLLRRGDFFGLSDTMAAFRVGTQSISATLTSAQYADQKVLTERIVDDPFWALGPTGRWVGRAGTVNARLRHRALFFASSWRHRRERDGASAGAHQELAWLGGADESEKPLP